MVRSLFVSTTFIFVMEPSVELPTRDCVVPKTVDQKKDRATFCLASTWEEYGIILLYTHVYYCIHRYVVFLYLPSRS